MPRANRGVLSRGPSQVLRKKALGLSNMRRHCVWVKDDDCGTLAESAAAPAADRESVTSKQSGGLRGSRPDPVYNLDRQRAVAEKMQSRSAVIETAIIMILPAGVYAFRKYLVLGRLGEFCPSGINRTLGPGEFCPSLTQGCRNPRPLHCSQVGRPIQRDRG